MAKRECNRQCKKFTTVARACHRQLRAGELSSKGAFKSCMKRGLR